MKNIIGHRGCARMALENTQTVLQKALDLKVPVVEIDVRLTEDKQLIVCHDADLSRVAYDLRIISKHTLAQLSDTIMKDKSRLLSLEDALKLLGSTPVMIELKDAGSAAPLIVVLKNFPKAKVTVVSFKLKELQAVRRLRKSLPVYLLTTVRFFWAINKAKDYSFTGVGVHWAGMHIFGYRRLQEQDLKLYIYTVDSPRFARFLRKLYPQAALCTNQPDVLMKSRRKHAR